MARRSVLATIFFNFTSSLKLVKVHRKFVGEDYYGNKFYEIAEDRFTSNRRKRWFKPAECGAYDQEVAAEWEAWLRGRRENPPTQEELVRNFSVMQIKKRNAIQIEKCNNNLCSNTTMQTKIKGPESFPKYTEYEIVPGKNIK